MAIHPEIGTAIDLVTPQRRSQRNYTQPNHTGEVQMRANIRGLSVALLSAGTLIAPTIVAPTALTAAYAICLPGEVIDGRTAEMARRQIESAGYSNVQMEHKGCDNVWHGFATRGGASGRVAVSPSGQVMPEGD